jgi:hypothetical protein
VAAAVAAVSCLIASVAATTAPSASAARLDAERPVAPATSAPTTSAPSSTAPSPSTPPATSTTTTVPSPPGTPTDPPPDADGGELPDLPNGPDRTPVVLPPGSSNLPGPTALDEATLAAEQRRIADFLDGVVDPLVEARRIEAHAIQSLSEADGILDTVRAEHVTAVAALDAAERREVQAGREAEKALARSRAAAAELRQMAIAMYLDTPKQQAKVLSVDRIEDKLSISALMSVTSEKVRRATVTAREAADEADEAETRASSAAAVAATAESEVATLLAAVESELAGRAEAVERVRATIAALGSQVEGFAVSTTLAELMSIEAVTASGVVLVDVAADGTWSVRPVGFPGSGDIVRIPGTTITVHRLIEGRVRALIAAAAADGVALNGWGHRDAMRQVELRRAHCGGSYDAVFHMPSASCRPPTARPGRSMHERGLAVDFAHCSSRTSPCYRWLAEHAAAYGLFNLPSEPWHWSVNGH